MIATRSRLTLMALLAACWLVAAPAPAQAKLAEGDAAPDFEGRDFINSEPFSLKNLGGRIVLFELFSTG